MLDAYRPCIVICACMPPGIDWSKSFRDCSAVVEYILVGPKDSDSSGDAFGTWGCAAPFHRKGRAPAVPRYTRDGFVRSDIEALSLLCLGTCDAPGRVGANAVVSFRRLAQLSLTHGATPLA